MKQVLEVHTCPLCTYFLCGLDNVFWREKSRGGGDYSVFQTTVLSAGLLPGFLVANVYFSSCFFSQLVSKRYKGFMKAQFLKVGHMMVQSRRRELKV